MPFPKTEEELVKAGYLYDNTGKCSGCGQIIEWWITPNQKRMPMDPGIMESHFSTCPKADKFRKK